MAITRISTNQISDGAVTASKIADASITGGKLENNMTYGSNLTVTGTLTVNGSTTTVNSTTVSVDDPILLLAPDQSGAGALDIGFIGERGDDTNIAFVWDESADKFVAALTSSADSSTTITVSSYADMQVKDLDLVNLTATGDVTVSGDMTVTGTQTFTGALAANGGITVDTTNFVVDGSTGAVSTASTLTVSGATSLQSTLAVTGATGIDGDFDINTNKFTVASASGNTVIAGTLSVTGAQTLTGNTSMSGNATVGGTLGVTGESTLASAIVSDLTAGRVVLAGTAGAIEDSGNLTFNGSLLDVTGGIQTSGNITIGGNLTVNGSTTTVNSTTVTIDDAIFQLGGDTAPSSDDNKDRGIAFRWHNGTAAKNGFFGYDDSASEFVFIADGSEVAGVITGDLAAAAFGTMRVEDLTSGRVLLAGASGEVEDSGNLTFNGSALSVTGTAAISSNATVGGTLGVTGEATLASATVSDLTNNRIVIAGASGSLEDDANLTFDGTTFEVGTAFDVTAASGNTTIGGTLGVTGVTTLSGALNADGGIAVDTSNFTVNGASGAVATASTLDVAGLASLDGGIDVDGAFTVADSTGNVNTSGSIDATGTITGGTLTDGTASLTSGALSGATTGAFSSNVTVGGTLGVTGDTTMAGLTTTGNVTVGGNLTVSGTTTTVNSTVVEVADPIMTLGTDGNDDNLDRGIKFKWHNGTAAKAGFYGYDDSASEFIFVADATDTASVMSGSLSPIAVGSIRSTDLTDNRVLIAGASGEIEDDANLTFNGTTLTVASAGGASISNALTVGGATSLQSTLAVTGATSLNGAVTLGDAGADAITVTGTATFAQPADFDGGFTIAGTQTVNMGANRVQAVAQPTADQDAATKKYVDDLLSAGFDISDGTDSQTISQGDTFIINGTPSEVNVAVSATDTLTIGLPDSVTISDALTVTGAATVGTTLGVTGATTLSSTLAAGNTTITGTLSTSGAATLNSATVTGNAGVGGTLTVTGASTLNNTLDVAGLASLDGGIDVDGAFTVADTSGNVSTTGTLAAGNTTITGTLGVSSNVTIDGNLTVSGTTTTVNSTVVEVADPIMTIGDDSSDDNLDRGLKFKWHNGTAAKAGFFGYDESTGEFVFIEDATDTASVMSGSLGSAAFGSARVTDLTSGRVLLAGTSGEIEDSGNLTFNGSALTVTGTATVSSNATVQGNLSVTGTQTFTGATTMSNNATVGGTLGVTGATTLSTLTATGAAALNGGISVDTNKFTVADTTGNVATAGTLDVTGATTLTGLLTANGGITADSGVFTVADTTGNVHTSGTLNADGAATLGSTLGVTGATTLSSTLGVTGATTLTGALTANGTVSLDDAVTINESGADVDFRVEGSTNANMLIVDAGTDSVLIGTATPVTDASFVIGTTDSFMLPVGSNAQRPATGVQGMFRFNNISTTPEYYDGSKWTQMSTEFTVIASETFNGDGATTAFTLQSSQTTASTIVSINGVVQLPTTAYSVSGTTLTFTEAPATGDVIEVRELTTTETVVSLSNTAGTATVECSEANNNIAVTCGTMTITGNLVATGSITANGDLAFGDANTDSITFNADVASSILPDVDATYNLGSSSAKWNNVYGVNVTATGTTTLGDLTIGASKTISMGSNKITGVAAPTASTDAATKGYVDGLLSAGADIFTMAGDAGTSSTMQTGDTITISGGTGLSSASTADTVTINIDNTGVTAGSYGSATAIPVLAINAQGQVTSASTIAVSSDMSIAADAGTGGPITVGTDTLTISGGTNVNTSVSGDTITVNLDANPSVTSLTTSGNLTIGGNLTVSGTTTTVNTETINLADNIILINSNEAGAPSQNGGIEVERGTSTNVTLVWDETADKWTVGSQTFVAGTFEGNLTGNVTGNVTGNATGNAGTATKLATARTISLSGDISGSVSFDGSGNVDIATTVQANSVALGTDTTGNYVASGATSGNGISGSVSSEGGTFTVTSNATSANTANTIVYRDASGNFSAGVITGTATAARYADLAEKYAVVEDIEPGTVVCFGGDAEVQVCDHDMDRKVAGVVSTDPAYMMNCEAEGAVYVALQGRVPCKVVGPVRKGDMMVSAGNGAARAEENPVLGSVIGKALENFDGEEGVIEVVVGRL
jgi:hypothetical protein